MIKECYPLQNLLPILIFSLAALLQCNMTTGQNISPHFFQLDEFVANGDWESKEGKRIASQIIKSAQKEYYRLNSADEEDLDQVSLDRLGVLESALEPFLVDLHKADMEQRRSELIWRAKTAYSVLGQDVITSDVALKVLHRVKARIQKLRKDAFSPSTLLSDEKIQRVLELTEEQEGSFDKLFESFRLKIQSGSKDEFEEMKRLYQMHHDAIVSILTGDQKQVFREIVGPPINWFRNANDEIFSELGPTHFFTRIPAKESMKAGIDPSKLSLREIRERGVEFLHGLTSLLLLSPFVWDEIELTVEQREQVKKDVDVYASSKFHDLRLSELLDGEAAYPSSLRNILLDKQASLLAQIELQVLTKEFASSFGVLHPKVSKTLSLSRDQIAKIETLRSDFEEKTSSLLKKIKVERGIFQRDFEQEVASLLKPEQLELFNKLQGQWIELKKL